MTRVVHDLQQGTPAWAAHRRTHLNASDAAAMLGVSPYVTRSDLVRDLALGIDRDPSPEQAQRFADGHAFEAMARPWAEEIIGEELFPVVASLTVDGLALSASVDGVTMDEATLWEHKSLNRDLEDALSKGFIPASYHPQVEQQLLILGAKRCLFMASNGSRETMKCAWYEPNLVLRSKIIAGWKQFAEDVAQYQHVEVIPAPAATLISDLPAVVIDIKGDINLASNLDRFAERLKAFVEAIPDKPSSDLDFANCEAACKTLQLAQDRLEAAEEAALSRLPNIDDMKAQLAALKTLARTQRLALEKLVKARKDEVRAEILREGQTALALHITNLNVRLGRNLMPPVPGSFVDAMKGKKTIAGLRDAVNVTLAAAKIDASEIADRVEMNLKALAAMAAGYEGLFADLPTLCLKGCDDFKLVVRTRVEDHLRAEAKRLDDERERIRVEEEAKARTKVESEARASAPVSAAPTAANDPPRSQAPSARTSARPSMGQRPKPSDEAIVSALVEHFDAPAATVLQWLRDADLDAVSRRLGAEVAA